MDQDLHFVASVLNNLSTKARVRHRSTNPCCPWANGTVEQICRKVIRTGRAFLSEWKLPAHQYPSTVSVIQNVINQSPVDMLAKNKERMTRCPMEVVKGLEPSALLLRSIPLIKSIELKALNEARAKEVMNIGAIHESLEEMHREVGKGNELRCQRARRMHNAKTDLLLLNIIVGD